MTKQTWLYLVAATVVICAGCARQPIQITAENKGAADRIIVKTVAVESKDIERTTTQPATIHAFHRAEIRAKATGYVKEIAADIGDYVKAGDTLAVLDVPEMAKQREIIEARIRRYESEEQRAKAGLQLAQATIDSAKAKVGEATSEVKQATASLAAAEAEFNRTQDLVQRKSLQRRMLDEATKKRDSMAASQDATRSGIQSAEAEVVVAEAKLASAEADSNAAFAETEIARRQLEELDVLMAYAELKAPFDGIVTQRSIDPGDLVRAQAEAGPPLFVISQIDKVRIHVPVPEVDAARVSKGDTLTLKFPSFPAESISATVTRVSGELDPSTRTMLIEAELPNPDGKLVPGMFGQASIATSTKTAANMLPARAVRFDEKGGAYVYKVVDEAISIAQVETGFDDGKFIEVTGLSPGQQVVDAHLKRFTDGQKVSVAN